MPAQATSLLDSSLKNMTQNKGAGITVLSIGGVLALWSLTGAMQNVMWATNIAYERDERRGFVRRRITALWMVQFALIGLGAARVLAVQRYGGNPLVIDIAKPAGVVHYVRADLADTAAVDAAARELA